MKGFRFGDLKTLPVQPFLGHQSSWAKKGGRGDQGRPKPTTRHQKVAGVYRYFRQHRLRCDTCGTACGRAVTIGAIRVIRCEGCEPGPGAILAPLAPGWTRRAACDGQWELYDGIISTGGGRRKFISRFCDSCPVRDECSRFGQGLPGIWGGIYRSSDVVRRRRILHG